MGAGKSRFKHSWKLRECRIWGCMAWCRWWANSNSSSRGACRSLVAHEYSSKTEWQQFIMPNTHGSDPSSVSSDRDYAATIIPQHVDLLSTTQTAASTCFRNVAATSFCNRLLDSGHSLSCASYESFEHSLTDDAAASPATVASCTSLPSADAMWDHDLHHVRTCSSPPVAGSPYLGPNTAMAGYDSSYSSSKLCHILGLKFLGSKCLFEIGAGVAGCCCG